VLAEQVEDLLVRAESVTRLKRFGEARSSRVSTNVQLNRWRLCLASCVCSSFVATVSHELRTPMTGLSSVVDLLLKTSLDSDQREMLGMMSASVQVMLRLINDILLFSKVGSTSPYFCSHHVCECLGFALYPCADRVGSFLACASVYRLSANFDVAGGAILRSRAR
jgi:hypothetical protein